MSTINQDFQKLIAEQKRINQKITVGVEIITPEMALKYLQKNLQNHAVKNRKIHNVTVNKYVNDILNDRWKIGAPFIFDSEDNLIDGQTRCTAVVKAQKSIISLVVRGVDTDIFDVLDCGKRRTPKDVLTTIVENGKQLTKAAGVSAGIALMQSVMKNHKAIDKNRILTNPALYSIVKNDFNYYNEPFESGKISTWRKNINLSVAENVLAGFYYAKKKDHGKVVDDFLTLITSNTSTTPVVVREFRDMMIANKGKRSDERGYLPPYKVYYLIDTLFKYSQEKSGLANRKHFSTSDLQKINEL